MKRNKNISTICLILIYALGLLAWSAFYYFQKSDAGLINNLITCGFFIISAIIFVFAWKFLSDGNALINALIKAKVEIDELKKNNTDILNALKIREKTFDDDVLNCAFEQYKEDLASMSRVTGEANVDIEDYINRDLLEDRIKVHYLNQVPGVMTGLGILGTFLGLSVGLSSFDLTGSASDITGTIKPLMDGIKVAFHTSIFGLIYSIGYGFAYKYVISTYYDQLNRFLEFYRRNVVDITKNGSEASIIKYEKQITDLLAVQAKNQNAFLDNSKVFLENQEKTIAAILHQNLLTEEGNEQLVNQISQMMKDILVPEIQSMSIAVNKFAESTRTDQMEELQKIVDNFVALMNEALKNSFADLAGTLEKVNEWQQKSLEEMQLVLEQVDKKSVELSEVNSNIAKAASTVADYTAEVEKMQEGITANIESLNIQAEANNELVEKQSEYLDMITKNEETTINVINQILDGVENQTAAIRGTNEKINEQLMEQVREFTSNISEISKNALEQSRKGIEEISSISVTSQNELKKEFENMSSILETRVEELRLMSNSISDEMKKSASELGDAAKTLNDGLVSRITETFQTFDNQLSECVRHFAGTIQHMDKSVGKTKITYDSMSDDITDKFAEMQNLLDQYLEYADKLHHDISLKWQQLRDEVPEE